MAGNREMKELKFRVNYERLLEAVDSFPAILGECKAVFEGVRDLVKGRLEEAGRVVLIHGDFWSGK